MGEEQERKMLSNELQKELVNYTVKNSGHIMHRAYIGLSEIGDCEQVIYDRYQAGWSASIGQHLLFKLGNELEAALISRLGKLYKPAEAITLFEGLVQGHMDGLVHEDVLEIKTLPQESYFPKDHRVGERIYLQVQAYMHYTGRAHTHVVFLARDTGAISVVGVHTNERAGGKIEAKVNRLVRAVEERIRPACSCRRCDGKEGLSPRDGRN